MSTNIKKSFKKSNVHAKSDFDFYQLQRKSEYLLNCKIERSIDEIIYDFELQEEQSFQEVFTLTTTYKYQLLINISHLLEDSKRLSISLAPENLYFDINMMPKAMIRDVYEENTFDESIFVQQYKSLIGYVLQNKYSYADFYQGGNQLLAKNKLTAPFVTLETHQEILETLHKEYKKVQEKLQYAMMEVDKKKYKRLKISSRLSLVLLIFAIGVGGYFGGYRLFEETTFNTANEFYIKQDYVSVIDTLNSISIKRMNTNTKYILAIANIKAESLTDEQKNNILSSVSLNSDTRILEFWIMLGQKNNEKAIDLAKQLGNKEYIAYAYMKEKATIENDTSLSGSEREEKLNEIEENLKSVDITQENSTESVE